MVIRIRNEDFHIRLKLVPGNLKYEPVFTAVNFLDNLLSVAELK